MKLQRITRKRTCPVCKGSEAYRVRRTGITVKVMCRLFNLRPHYCPECDTFYLGPRQSKESRPDTRFGSPAGPRGERQPQPGSLSN